jgi:hypothetical protein
MHHHVTYKFGVRILNTKLLLAPVLAITLALLIAGAMSMILPQDQTTPSLASLGDAGQTYATPMPTFAVPMPTTMPAPEMASVSFFLPFVVMFIAAIVIVVAAVILLFFREKNLDQT